MSTEIKPTSISVNIDNTNKLKANTSKESSTVDSTNTATPSIVQTDKVSMTDAVSRLQGIESMLADIPDVDNNLVNEIAKALQDGNLNIDYEATAAKLIEMETGEG